MEYDSGTKRGRCLECGGRIRYGRNDKKFCCETCKNRYNNRRARSSRGVKVRVLSALEKNYGILDRVLKQGVVSISAAELRQQGFNFDYVTSYHKVRRHDEFSCFDISFTVVADMVISINRPGFSVRWGKSRNVSLNLQNVSGNDKLMNNE